MAASRFNDATAAYGHLTRAKEIAGRLGDGRNDYNTEFGPANVALHEIAVAIESGDAGHALRVAATVDVSGLSVERRYRMLIDVTHAQAQRRQVAEATSTLLEAEQIAPEQFQNLKVIARPFVTDLLTRQEPSAAELRELASRVGA